MRNFLDCVKSRALPTCDIEIAHRLDEYLPPRKHLLQAGPKARVGCRRRTLQERPGAARSPRAARASAGLMPAQGRSSFQPESSVELTHEQDDRAHHPNDRHADRDARSLGRLPGEPQQDSLGHLDRRASATCRSPGWLSFVGLIIWLAGVFIVYSNKPLRRKKMRLDDERALIAARERVAESRLAAEGESR